MSQDICIDNFPTGFIKLKELGRGAESVVYKYETPNGEFIAVKEYKPGHTYTDELSIIEKFDESSPFLKYYGVKDIGGKHYMFMEYFEGGTWLKYRKRFVKGDPTNITDKLNVLIEKVIHMLKYLHSKRILHSDFGSGKNVLINDDRIVIIDFGMNVSTCSFSNKYNSYSFYNNYTFFTKMLEKFIEKAIKSGFIINDGCETLTKEKVSCFLDRKYVTLMSGTY